MDGQHIRDVLYDLELDAEPAFATLRFKIDARPFFDHLLGVYYPDSHMIVIPPSADERTLLHELGHAWAYYNWHDLSEEAAEGFRIAFQGNGHFKPAFFAALIGGIMGMTLI